MVLGLAVLLPTTGLLQTPALAAPTPPVEFIGRQACAPCHKPEIEGYAGSHHDLAMQVADAKTVLGNFDGATFEYNGLTSTFTKKKDGYYVRTDGADGKLHDFRIAYTFGIAPLQQYLIQFPDGRLQALSICWDTRPKDAGGQHWFHLYPNDKVDYRDVLHWTGPAQNWNFMCAECHSTNVRKNFDATKNRFSTSWSELDVSCEACHGPGAKHIAWAKQAKTDGSAADPMHGLPVKLSVGSGVWQFDAEHPIAQLSDARDTRAQIETCGRCHARRSQISEAYRYGEPLAQTHVVSLLDEGLYHADGQILEEVYEYGSFLQSRMYARGVTCGDCHDPHSGKLKAEGNTLCATCHRAETYDVEAHHHHPAGSTGTSCIGCHMLQRNYMVVHTRHDHSFRVPRPDLAASLGTPDTCTSCHQGRTPGWAAEAIVKWYGPTRERRPFYAPALAAGRRQQAGAETLLTEVVTDNAMPALVRATAVGLLGRGGDGVAERILGNLGDADPLVRRAAVEASASWSPQRRVQAVTPLLADPIRTVRLAAVDALADVAAAAPFKDEQRKAFSAAVAEYRDVQALNADRADSWLNLGALDVRLGNPTAAEAAYQRAIRVQPDFMPSYVNLADLYRGLQRDADGEHTLRQALARQANSADVHHSLGLLLIRQKHNAEALAELGRAAELAPDVSNYAYVYAVALDGMGQPAQALRVLEQTHQRFTGDRNVLSALMQFAAKAGDNEGAARWGQELQNLDGGQP